MTDLGPEERSSPPLVVEEDQRVMRKAGLTFALALFLPWVLAMDVGKPSAVFLWDMRGDTTQVWTLFGALWVPSAVHVGLGYALRERPRRAVIIGGLVALLSGSGVLIYLTFLSTVGGAEGWWMLSWAIQVFVFWILVAMVVAGRLLEGGRRSGLARVLFLVMGALLVGASLWPQPLPPVDGGEWAVFASSAGLESQVPWLHSLEMFFASNVRLDSAGFFVTLTLLWQLTPGIVGVFALLVGALPGGHRSAARIGLVLRHYAQLFLPTTVALLSGIIVLTVGVAMTIALLMGALLGYWIALSGHGIAAWLAPEPPTAMIEAVQASDVGLETEISAQS